MADRDLTPDAALEQQNNWLLSFLPDDHPEREHVGQPYWSQESMAANLLESNRQLLEARAALRDLLKVEVSDDCSYIILEDWTDPAVDAAKSCLPETEKQDA